MANIKELRKKYPYIVAWGKMIGSMDYYINDMVRQAEKDGAPEDATYVKNVTSDNATGKWSTMDGVVNANTRIYLEEVVEKLKSKG